MDSNGGAMNKRVAMIIMASVVIAIYATTASTIQKADLVYEP